MAEIGLIYTGDGAFLPDVPARNLTFDEVEQFGGKEFLLKTGIYRLPEKRDIVGGRENKLGGKEVNNG